MSIGRNIKLARASAGMTQKELASKCKVAEITIRQYETGKREPRMSQIEKIASVLGCSTSFLLSSDPPQDIVEWGHGENINDLDGIIVALVDLYGTVKAVEDKANDSVYYVVGENEDAFILYNDDIYALYHSVLGFMSPIIKRIKELSAQKNNIEYRKEE